MKNQLLNLIEKLENKNFNIYFFTLDTKGVATASVANIYENVKILNELGYKANILHEKNDYKFTADENGGGLSDWLGEEYCSLPHASIEGKNININAEDFIIIPEIFFGLMDQLKGFQCKKIVFSQAYDYILDMIPPGKSWNVDCGFNDAITTSDKQADYIKSLFPSVRTHIIQPSIPSYFKSSDKPKKPIISIVSRNQSDITKIVKSFYLQHPMYKWVTFRELRGLSRTDFAKALGESCLAVWLDTASGFGTFPLEAMECETPVIGLLPTMIPEWLETTNTDGEVTIANNGIWTNTTLIIPELIAKFMKAWLEDSVPAYLTDNMKLTTGIYTLDKQKSEVERVFNTLVTNRVNELKHLLPVEEPNETLI